MLIHLGIMSIVIQVEAFLEEDLLSYIEETPGLLFGSNFETPNVTSTF